MNEQLKQAIDESVRMGINIASDGYRTSKYSSNFSPQKNIETAMSDISILRHADPEIMRQAGWEPVQEWFSVEDRLPETDCLIDVYFVRSNYVYEGEYSPVEKRFYISYHSGTFVDNVTHWKFKPLPQPPNTQP